MRYLIVFAIFVLVVAVFIAGRLGWLVDFDALQTQLAMFRGSFWAFPIVIGIFCVGAFIGAPQYALIFGAVTLLGPIQGGVGAWIATLCSGSLTYITGLYLGRESFARLAGHKAQGIADKIAKNGFMSSLLVRLVPTAPFIVVNAAFAIGGVPFYKYLGGMALGIIPKIAIVTAAIQGLAFANSGNMTLAGIFLALTILAFWALYSFVQRRKRGEKPTIP